MPAPRIIVAFDLYGTLLDTNGINNVLQSRGGITAEQAAGLSKLWRRYQLEYTWRLNSMGIFQPFDEVTRKSLVHALRESDVNIDSVQIDSIMDSYNSLSAFSDAQETLLRLQEQEDVRIIVFSNGSPEMIFSAMEAAQLNDLVDAVHDVGYTQKYKPCAEAYRGLLGTLEHLEFSGNPELCWLVSGNPFDVVGARAVGMSAIWVDRLGKGWMDMLGGEPSMVVKDLSEVVHAVTKILQELPQQ